MTDDTLTCADVARVLRVALTTAQGLCRTGRLASTVRPDQPNTYRVQFDDLHAFIQSGASEARTPDQQGATR